MLMIGIGVAGIAYGLFTLVMRVANPSGFGKLDAMKERMGDALGTTVHVIAYTIMPIVFGVVMLISGINTRAQ
jgi:translation elongation factor EF-1beta